MSWHQLVLKEIRLRRMSFAVATLAVTTAVAVALVQLWQLHLHDASTAHYLSAQRVELEAEVQEMEDDYRKITKGLGYNLVILPASQNLDEYYSGAVTRTRMPEQNATKLVRSDLMTVQHVLPIVEGKLTWPERRDRAILIAGSRGEFSVTGQSKAPLVDAVPRGQAVVGYRLWSALGIKQGDALRLRSRQFTIRKCMPERGNKEDITFWTSLEDAQDLLDCRGELHAILALKCHCRGNDLQSVRAAVAQILPDVTVVELADKALARAEARDRAHQSAVWALTGDEQRRAELGRQRRSLAGWLIPAVWLGAAVVTCALTLLNVRERQSEIGVLRAFGARSSRVLVLVLARSFLFGAVGTLVGLTLAAAIVSLSGEGYGQLSPLWRLPGARLDTVLLLAAAPISAVLIASPCAIFAAMRDPALVLRQD